MSISFNHPLGRITSTSQLTITASGGTVSSPNPIRLVASSIIMPNVQQPTGEPGAMIYDVSTSTMRYFNGFQWISWVSKDEIVNDINISLADIYNKLATKIDAVSYNSNVVPGASISGTTLNITFPTGQGGGGTSNPGMFTSLPTGSISHYSLVSGQNASSVRENMGGSAGSQNGRNGTQTAPYITSSGWTLADGNYWLWRGPNGDVVQRVPNLNRNAYLKGMDLNGITKTDDVIWGTGSIGGTSLNINQLPAHNFSFSGTTSVAGNHIHMSGIGPSSFLNAPPHTVKNWQGGDNTFYNDTGGTGPAGDHNHTYSGTTNTLGGNQSHTHTLDNVDLTHFNTAVLYNIAQPGLALNQQLGDARYVLKAGDTMTGTLSVLNNLNVRGDALNLTLYFNTTSLAERAVIYHQNSTNTLRFRANAGSELILTQGGQLTTQSLVVNNNAATVGGRNIVRAVNGNTADANGNVNLPAANTSSLGTNGWIRDAASGFTQMWCQGALTDVEGTQTINFPTPFPNNCFNVQVTTWTGSNATDGHNDNIFQIISWTRTSVVVIFQHMGEGTWLYGARPVIYAVGN